MGKPAWFFPEFCNVSNELADFHGTDNDHMPHRVGYTIQVALWILAMHLLNRFAPTLGACPDFTAQRGRGEGLF